MALESFSILCTIFIVWLGYHLTCRFNSLFDLVLVLVLNLFFIFFFSVASLTSEQFVILSNSHQVHDDNRIETFKCLWPNTRSFFRLRFLFSHIHKPFIGTMFAIFGITYVRTNSNAPIMFCYSCTAWATSLLTHLTKSLKFLSIWITVLISLHAVCFTTLNVTVRIEFCATPRELKFRYKSICYFCFCLVFFCSIFILVFLFFLLQFFFCRCCCSFVGCSVHWNRK